MTDRTNSKGFIRCLDLAHHESDRKLVNCTMCTGMYKVRGRWSIKNYFRDLGAILKRRTSKVVLSETLPVTQVTPERYQELGGPNK